MNLIKLDLHRESNKIEITSDSEVNAIFIGKNHDAIKSKLEIVHKKPNLKSRINIKAVVLDSSKFDFEGLLRIEKGASGSDAYLKVNCLVIGENASARAVPSLEILESDVKGGHGATIGYIDEEMLHYLSSRGLDKTEVEALIIESFIKS